MIEVEIILICIFARLVYSVKLDQVDQKLNVIRGYKWTSKKILSVNPSFS